MRQRPASSQVRPLTPGWAPLPLPFRAGGSAAISPRERVQSADDAATHTDPACVEKRPIPDTHDDASAMAPECVDNL